jgi:hypothetical protein
MKAREERSRACPVKTLVVIEDANPQEVTPLEQKCATTGTVKHQGSGPLCQGVEGMKGNSSFNRGLAELRAYSVICLVGWLTAYRQISPRRLDGARESVQFAR